MPINKNKISKMQSLLLTLTLMVTAFWVSSASAQKYVTDPSTGKVVTAPEYGGTLTFASKITPPTFDSHFHPWAVNAIGGVVESLAIVNWGIDRNEYAMRSPTFRPLWVMKGQLAESWETPDPLTIILHIRQGFTGMKRRRCPAGS